MDNKIKKIALIGLVISILGQVAFLMYLTRIHKPLTWQLIAGSSVIIMGILILLIFSVKRTLFKGKELLFYAVIINPGLVSIFSGIVLITTQYPRLKYISVFAGGATILGIIIGFITFVVFLMRRNSD